jgi:hypothetical protein
MRVFGAAPEQLVIAQSGETVELAFLATNQLLQRNSAANLLLRDVLAWSAAEAPKRRHLADLLRVRLRGHDRPRCKRLDLQRDSRAHSPSARHTCPDRRDGGHGGGDQREESATPHCIVEALALAGGMGVTQIHNSQYDLPRRRRDASTSLLAWRSGFIVGSAGPGVP